MMNRSPRWLRLLRASAPWVIGVSVCMQVPGQALAQSGEDFDRRILPVMPAPFTGKVGEGPAQSQAAFRQEVKAPTGAPNVLIVMTDDVGFAAASAFGGLIPTPALDALSARGLRYNNFHTTAMCSPSRAALLTGRNHHAVGMGTLSDYAEGYPGYDARIPKSAATIAETLKQNGFSTAFFGKHHNVPKSENSVAGPFDHWPTGLGFDYFYGFLGSQTDQFNPGLIRGVSRVDEPGEGPLDKLLVDDAIAWVHNIKAAKPDKPFFAYLAPGTAHAPLQAPADWIARFKGKFDAGWDKSREQIFARQKAAGIVPKNAVLTPRPAMIPAWSSLSSDQKRVAARMMEIYAAQLAFQDAQFGRLVDELRRMGELDNTVVIFIEGDNGASAEGGEGGTTNDFGRLVNKPPESEAWLVKQLDALGSAETHAHYPAGWAWAMNTPFQLFKRFASHLGGVRNGMVISWPKGIDKQGEVRSQFTHLTDIVPTVLDMVGVPAPLRVNGVDQQPMAGFSLRPTFAVPSTPSPHRLQYFEMLGNRALYQDGWLASTIPPADVQATSVSGRIGTGRPVPATEYQWQLFDLTHDFSQSRDLSARYPDRLAAMRAEWTAQAERNNVFPINSFIPATRGSADVDAHMPVRDRYEYWGSDVRASLGTDPPILTRSHALTAEITLHSEPATGVIASYGNRFAGWSLYLKNGILTLHEAYSDQPEHQYSVRARTTVPVGRSVVGYRLDYLKEGGAHVVLTINGTSVGEATFPHKINRVDQTETFDIGRDLGGPVVGEYDGRGVFPGEIARVQISTDGKPD